MSGGCVIQVWFADDDGKPVERGQRPAFDLIELDEAFSDFAVFATFCNANPTALVSGAQLFTRKGDQPGERIVYRRMPFLFRADSMKRATLPTWKLVEVDDT